MRGGWSPAGRIVLVTSSLGGGGAERVLLLMATYWAQLDKEVFVVTLRKDPPREYSTPPGVRVVRIGIIQEHNPVWQLGHVFRLWRLRAGIVALKPDLVISFIDKLNAAVLLALAGTGICVVATEHLAPWMNPLGGFWERLRRVAYSRARVVVSPTRAITDWFSRRQRGRYETLPYPSLEVPPTASTRREPVILAVGRLAEQKGFDLLIDSFAAVMDRWPEWKVMIAGEGPERQALNRRIEEKGAAGRVELVGFVEDMPALYRRAEIFLLPSRHEAYPMVLCEALSAGCCILAADCPTGPREILADGQAGDLVPPEDAGALASALENLLGDPARRDGLRSAARDRFRELSPEAVMARWDEAIGRWTRST